MSRSRSARRQNEIATASATRTSEAATSPRLTSIEELTPAARSSGPALDRPAVLEPHHPLAEPPRLLGVVGDEDERDLQLPPQLGEGRLDRVAGGLVERRGRLVEQEHLGPLGQRPRQHRPLLLADRELRDVALGEARRRARRGRGSGRRRARCPARPRGEAEVRPDRSLEQRRQLRHQRDLAPQLQRVVLAERPAAVARPCPGSGSASRLSSRSRVDLPLPEGPTIAVAPRGISALDRVEDRPPAAGAGRLPAARRARRRSLADRRQAVVDLEESGR